jgi:integrase/recombinase XerD
MRCLVTDQLVLSRAPEGPLSTYIRPFADLLSAQGYAPKSIHRQVHLAACFTERPVFARS